MSSSITPEDVPLYPAAGSEFSSDAVRADLAGRSVRSGFINIGSRVVQVGLGVGGTMVLARILTPADFGVYAMAAILIGFIGTFRDFGLPLATVHREAIDTRGYSALFWLYQSFNLVLGLAVLAFAPVIAWFYGEPRLVALTAAMAVGVFALGVATQHQSLLERQMRFATLTVIDVAGTVLGLGVGIVAALLGAGYWALVLQFLTMCGAKAIGCWTSCRWRPEPLPPREWRTAAGVGGMLRYGWHVTAARFVKHLGRNLDQVIIGYAAGSHALGLYHNADRWAMFPAQQLFAPLQTVAITGLSRVQNEPALFRTYAHRGLLPVFALTLPTIAFLFVQAEQAIRVLLGTQWLDAVPLFRILCVAAFVGKLATVVRWLNLASGATARQLRWEMFAAPVMMAAVLLGSLRGVHGVALGFTIGTALLAYPNISYCLRGSPLRTRDFLGIVWRPATAALVAAGVVALVAAALHVPWPPLPALVASALLFGGIYIIVWLLLPGGRAAARAVLQLAQALRRPGGVARRAVAHR